MLEETLISSSVETKSVTGNMLLKALSVQENSIEKIYGALLKCRSLLVDNCSFDEKKSLSLRQSVCAGSVINFIMENKYNLALRELKICIDDYGMGKERQMTVNEYTLYNCILNCFIARLEEQCENLERNRL